MSPANKNYIGVSLVALAVFLVMAMVLPKYNQMSDYRLAIKDRQATLAERQGLIKKIQELQSEYTKRKDEVSKFASIIPSRKSSAEIVSAVENISSTSGLQLIGMTTSDIKAEEGANYETLFMEINLAGQYTSLVNFLASLEKNLRLIDVESIEAGLSPTAGGQPILTFKIRTNTYYIK